jgi:protein O-mannosyl-transferase
MNEATSRRARLATAAAVMLLAAIAFEGVRRCGFVAFDDNLYVYDHPLVTRGLTWEGVRWAFAADLWFESPHADYWMPVTILSRMLDVELFGLRASGHHVMNAAFHALNAALVFLMLEGLTGARWRSAFAAALFAVHPLTVESVAWVTERKDVLSGLFWTLTVIAYTRHAATGRRAAYVAAMALMAAGLMAKPTLVTLPMVLLALDFWPLRRLPARRERVAALLAEKAPFFVLSLASAAVTLAAHSRGGHLAALDHVPLAARIANAVWSLVLYVGKIVWPVGLAVPYPYVRTSLLSGRIALAGLLLAVAAYLVMRSARARPYLLTGSAWYALALLPVLGVVQTGQQGHADRFMYVPLVGVGIVLAWGAADLASASPILRRLAPWAAAAALGGCVALTRAQVEHWRSTVSLFTHAVQVTRDNHVAHHNLATALAMDGDLVGAERHYREALRIRPGYVEARSAFGVVLERQGRLQEALVQQQEALRLAPSSADVHFNLGLLWARLGRPSEAAARYADAVRLNPGLVAAHYNWGNLLAAAGRWPEAEARFREAVRLDPGHLDARNNLGLAVGLQGGWPEAERLLAEVVGRDPGYLRARVNLGRALRELGRLDEARAQWGEVLARGPQGAAADDAKAELAQLDRFRAAR